MSLLFVDKFGNIKVSVPWKIFAFKNSKTTSSCISIEAINAACNPKEYFRELNETSSPCHPLLRCGGDALRFERLHLYTPRGRFNRRVRQLCVEKLLR